MGGRVGAGFLLLLAAGLSASPVSPIADDRDAGVGQPGFSKVATAHVLLQHVGIRGDLAAFGHAEQRQIVEHVTQHRVVLRDFFVRQLRSGPELSDTHAGARWSPRGPQALLFQHPAIRPLLELCVDANSTHPPRGPAVSSSNVLVRPDSLEAAPDLFARADATAAPDPSTVPARLRALFQLVQWVALVDIQALGAYSPARGLRRPHKVSCSRVSEDVAHAVSARTAALHSKPHAGAGPGPFDGQVSQGQTAGTRVRVSSRQKKQQDAINRTQPLRRRRVLCSHEKCPTFASYGDPRRRIKLYCGKHKKAGHVDLKNGLCMFPEGCTSRATYGQVLPKENPLTLGQDFGGPETGQGVSAGAENGDPGLLAGKGNTDGGGGGRVYGIRRVSGGRRRGRPAAVEAAFCAVHKRPTDVRLYRRLCEVKGCSKLPTFGGLTERRARRCAAHREVQMIDVNNRRCIMQLDKGLLCNRRAHWADASDLRPIACTLHRLPTFVDLMHGGVKRNRKLLAAVQTAAEMVSPPRLDGERESLPASTSPC